MTRTITFGVLLLSGCTDVENLGARSHPVFGSPPRWAITLGNVDNDAAGTVAFDWSGDVIAGGGFKGSVDFGRSTLVGTHPASWISKRSGLDGTELWTVGIGVEPGAQAAVVDLGTTADGSVIVLGSFGGDLNLGNVILHAGTTTTGQDCFVAKYNPAGQLQWARQLGPATLASCSDLAVADDGRFAIVGGYKGTLELPGKTATAGDGDPFMIAFDAAGQPVFGVTTQNPDGVQGMYAASVAISGENDVLIAGGIGFPMVFERVILQPNARTSQYVARFTLDGRMLWAEVLGDRDVQQQSGPISVDSNGGVNRPGFSGGRFT